MITLSEKLKEKSIEKTKKENKVFLGGTCNESTWRDYITSKLEMPFFNPVVDDWTPECQAEEERQKQICKYQLYVITPRMTGVFSIAEAVDSSNKLPNETLFCVTKEENDNDWTSAQIKSLEATKNLIKSNGAYVCETLDDVIKLLNKLYKEKQK